MVAISVLAILYVCIFVVGECEKTYSGSNYESYWKRVPENVREKRSRYYPMSPHRLYRRPSTSYPVMGVYSYTPPPGHIDEEGPQYPSPVRPAKVSKKPLSDSLADEDISNLVKYLTKQDFDKILQYAGETDHKYFQTKDETDPYTKNEDVFKSDVNDLDSDLWDTNSKTNSIDYNKPSTRPNQPKVLYKNPTEPSSYLSEFGQPKVVYVKAPVAAESSNVVQSKPFGIEQILESGQLSFLNGYEANNSPHTYATEEMLPKPSNLRDNVDYEVAYTNKVPQVIKSSSYDLKNFGDLPLMNYDDSKLYSGSSYHVPHYTVTAQQSHGKYAESFPIEPAPPVSAARDESEAHLKATKIWTHRSKGTAYYLHDDGTLSLERPRVLNPKSYGHP